jgi:hypothetical protein
LESLLRLITEVRLRLISFLIFALSCTSQLKGPPSPLQFSPFEREKSLRFGVFLKNERIGIMDIKIERDKENFRIVSKGKMSISGLNFEDTTCVLVTREGIPIKSFKLFTQIGELEILRKEIIYRGDTIFADIRGPDATILDTFLIQTPVYDNEEIIILLSRLPFKKGYWTRFPLFVGDERGIYQAILRVEEKREGYLIRLRIGEREIEILYDKNPPHDPISYFDKKSGFYLERMY